MEYLSDITNNLDNLRKPLNAQERELIRKYKTYPYCGANGVLEYVDEFIFDEKILCIAEDGGEWGYNQKCTYIMNEPCWVNNHAHVLTAKDKVSLEYLSIYLNFIDLNKFITGTTRGKLTKSALEMIQIPLPSYTKQIEIVSLLQKVKDIIQKRESQITALDELTQSLFLEMFGDPRANDLNWEIGTINDLTESTQYGSSQKASESEGKYPILRMNNIDYSGNWDFTSLKFIDLSEGELEKYTVRPGDILFNRTNSKELVGKTAVFNEEETYAYAGYLIRLRVNERANPEFVSNYLNSKYGKSILLNKAKSIVGMANINAQELKTIPIYLPPKELQDEFGHKKRAILEKKKILLNAHKEMENLYNSLLQKAFKGELFQEQ